MQDNNLTIHYKGHVGFNTDKLFAFKVFASVMCHHNLQ